MWRCTLDNHKLLTKSRLDYYRKFHSSRLIILRKSEHPRINQVMKFLHHVNCESNLQQVWVRHFTNLKVCNKERPSVLSQQNWYWITACITNFRAALWIMYTSAWKNLITYTSAWKTVYHTLQHRLQLEKHALHALQFKQC